MLRGYFILMSIITHIRQEVQGEGGLGLEARNHSKQQ